MAIRPVLSDERSEVTNPPTEKVRSTFSDSFLRIFGGSRPTLREKLGEPLGYALGHELVHLSAEGGYLLHAAGGDEADARAGHHVDGLDLGSQRPVELVHLELPLEVGDDAEALHDRLRSPFTGKVDDQLGEDVDLHILPVAERLVEECDSLVQREHRRLVRRAADDTDDDAVEDAGRARDDVDVAVRDRVVRARSDGGDHAGCSKTVIRVEPYVRLVRTASPGSSGSVRAADSSTSSPSSERTRGKCRASAS